MSNQPTRTERDSLGELEIPADAYYGVQTQRAIGNFPISGTPLPKEFIHAHIALKQAAAVVNRDLNLLKPEIANAIAQAAYEILTDAEWSKNWAPQFPIDIYQTGSATSTNMNVNEVLASRANEILGGKRGDKSPVHPNDHVNLGQSSNDTIPTSLQLMAVKMIQSTLLVALNQLRDSLERKSKALWPIIKTGRTHLQDATPIRMGQEFLGFADLIQNSFDRMILQNGNLEKVPLGGTAVGTGVNTHSEFAVRVCNFLKQSYAEPYIFLRPANTIWQQATLHTPLSAHAVLKSLAVSLIKIANDIRWMASGPRAGLGEIEIPAVQPGSSIMPGKTNPVIIESLLMVCYRVIGNDAALTIAATQANFELALSFPLAAHLLHESITLLANACTNFAKNCIDGITATNRGPELIEQGLMLATALAPVIGYDKAAEIAKEAARTGKTIREIAREKIELSEERLNELLDPGKMAGG